MKPDEDSEHRSNACCGPLIQETARRTGASGRFRGPHAPTPNAILDDMPGLLIDKHKHVTTAEGIAAGTASFHGILNSTDYLLQNGDFNSATILERLEAAYSAWDADLGPHVWHAGKAWLATKGVTP